MEAPTRTKHRRRVWKRWRVILVAILATTGTIAGGSPASAGRDSLPIYGWDEIYRTNFNSASGWTTAGAGNYTAGIASGRTSLGVFACAGPRWFEGCVDGQWAAARRTIRMPSSTVHPVGYESCKITVSARPTTGLYLASTGHRLNIEAIEPSTWTYRHRTTRTVSSTNWMTIETPAFAARDFVLGVAVEQRPHSDSYMAQFDDLVVSCYYFYYP